MDKPPIINAGAAESGKSRKMAFLMNCAIPGVGQLYLGQIVPGIIITVLFLAAFTGFIIAFFAGYGRYVSAAISNRAFDNVFDWKLIGFFFLAAMVLWVVSLCTLRDPRKQG